MKKVIPAAFALLLIIGFLSREEDVITVILSGIIVLVSMTALFYIFYLFIELGDKIIKYLSKNS